MQLNQRYPLTLTTQVIVLEKMLPYMRPLIIITPFKVVRKETSIRSSLSRSQASQVSATQLALGHLRQFEPMQALAL